MKRILSILALLAGAALADDKIIGILSSGTWTRTTSGNNTVLKWSAGGGGWSSYWTDPTTNTLLLRMWMDPTATNSSGKVVDSGPYAVPGTLTGATWTKFGDHWSTGRDEHGYSFDGSDDKIVLAHTNGWMTLTNGFTVMAWVWPSKLSDANDGIVSKRWGNSVADFNFNTSSNRLQLIVWNNGALSAWIGRQGPALANSNWVHVAAVWSGGTTDASCSLYTNGVQCDSADIGSGVFTHMHSATQITVGQARGKPSDVGWPGIIDDVRMYAGVVSTNDLATIVSQTQKPNNSNEDGY